MIIEDQVLVCLALLYIIHSPVSKSSSEAVAVRVSCDRSRVTVMVHCSLGSQSIERFFYSEVIERFIITSVTENTDTYNKYKDIYMVSQDQWSLMTLKSPMNHTGLSKQVVSHGSGLSIM